MKLKKDFELSLWEDFMDTGGVIKENKIATLANQSSDHPSAAYNVVFKSKTDGTHELTFDINYRYWDHQEQDFVENPFRKFLYNEAKIKLYYKNRWYDFLIKDCQENSKDKKFTYTCKDLYIDELGRNGYNVEFSTELGDNVGDIIELSEKALNRSGWIVDKENSYIPPQKNLETVFAYQLPSSLGNVYEIDNYGNKTSFEDIPSKATIFILYGSAKNKKAKGDQFQFYYEPDGIDTDNDGIFVKSKVKCLTGDNRIEFSSNFVFQPGLRGYRYIKSQKTEWLPKLNKRVSVYTDGSNEYYGYQKSILLSPQIAQNILINSGPNFKNTTGWQVITPDGGEELNMRIGGEYGYDGSSVKVGGAVRIQAFYYDEKREPVDVIGPVTFENLALKHNLKNIRSFEKGDIWVVRFLKGANYTITFPKIDKKEIFETYTPATPPEIEEDNYNYSYFKVSQTVTYDYLSKNPLPIQITSDIGCIEGVEMFSYYTYKKGEDEYLLIPESNITDQELIKTKYYYFTKQEYIECTNENDLEKSVEDTEPLEETIVYYENFKKVATLNIKESNYFNIIQELNEKFECWADFEIEHNIDGSIKIENDKPVKKVVYKEFIGKENYAGFKYGINLDSIQRTINSDQITTKTIVKPNNNEFALNGSCNIARAEANTSKSQAIINFDYYVNKGIFSQVELDNDLYSTGAGYLCYYENLRKLKEQIFALEDALIGEENIITKSNAEILSSDVAEQDFLEEIQAINESLSVNFINDQGDNPIDKNCIFQEDLESEDWGGQKQWKYLDEITFYSWREDIGYTPMVATSTQIYYLNKGKTLVDNYNSCIEKRYYAKEQKRLAESKKAEIKAALEGEYYYHDIDGNLWYYSYTEDGIRANGDLIDTDISVGDKPLYEQVNELEERFYNKYSRFIREGTWTSEEYTDDELYYYDACNVAHTSGMPKITYSINVFDVKDSIIPSELGYDYSNYDFECGDRTFIEDIEFFGWSYDKKSKERLTPYKEDIIVSETEEYLDNPEGSKITVQNFKTQFDDLFQRITATTQSLELKQGEYDKAAQVVSLNGEINKTFLQNTLLNNDLIFQNLSTKGLVWSEDGIVSASDDKLNLTKLVGGGIAISNDGGVSWSTGISGEGINASHIRSGTLDTGKVRIMSGDDMAFSWDANGINGYDIVNGKRVESKYTRTDRFGFYAVDMFDSNELEYKPEDEEAIWNNEKVLYCLIKKGLRIGTGKSAITLEYNKDGNSIVKLGNTVIDSDGKLNISTDDLEVNLTADKIVFTDQMEVKTVQMGVDRYALFVEKGGDKIFSVDYNGTMIAKDGEIGGWTINKDSIYCDNSGIQTFYLSSVNSKNSNWIMAEGPNGEVFKVTKDSKIFANSGEIGGWTINEDSISSLTIDGYFNLSSANSQTTSWIYAGHFVYDSHFEVTKEGILKANGAEIKGTIKAGSIIGDYLSLLQESGSLILSHKQGGSLEFGWYYYTTLKAGIGYGESSIKLYNTGESELGKDWIQPFGIVISPGRDKAYPSGARYGLLEGNWYLGGLTSASPIATTSDANQKNSIVDISDKYEIFFDNLKSRLYKFNNGTSDRYHTGFIAQEINESLQLAEIDTKDFGGLVIDTGEKEQKKWYLRYEEFISLNTWQIQKLKSRVTELENEIQSLKQKLS